MSKWQSATGKTKASRRGRGAKSAGDGSNTTSTLLLLLLLVAAIWLWQALPSQLPEPTAGDAQDGEVAALDTGPASDPGEALRDGAETGGDRGEDERGETASTRTQDRLLAPEPEDSEPEFPEGGESPSDWKPTQFVRAHPRELPSWYRGWEGYVKALQRKTRVETGMLIYFTTDWCPWSRRFEDEFLLQRPVGNWAEGLIRVRIDPEIGPDEAKIADKFSVNSFPAFFVIPPGTGQPVRLTPFPDGQAIEITDFLAQGQRAARSARVR